MYNRRLYAAPCQAVFAKTPVILTILLFKETIRYNLMTYWKRAIRSSMSLPCSDDEYLIAGITDQIMICKKGKRYIRNSGYNQNSEHQISDGFSIYKLSTIAYIILKGKKLRSHVSCPFE